jgi:hypothetical protein
VFYIEIDQSVPQFATLDVYTLSGQRVISQKQLRINEGKNVFMIETDSWNPGMYFLQLNGSSEKLLNQVVIKK